MGFICNIYLMLQLAYFLISSDTSYTILFMSMSIEACIMFHSVSFWFHIPGTQTCEESQEGKCINPSYNCNPKLCFLAHHSCGNRTFKVNLECRSYFPIFYLVFVHI